MKFLIKTFFSVGHISLDMLSRNSTGSWICLVYAYFFDKTKAGYAYKRYAYKKKICNVSADFNLISDKTPFSYLQFLVIS